MDKGDAKNVGPGWDKLTDGSTNICGPYKGVNFILGSQEKEGSVNMYEYNKFLWRTVPEVKAGMTMGMKDVPESFDTYFNMVKNNYKPAQFWKDSSFKAKCVDGKRSPGK